VLSLYQFDVGPASTGWINAQLITRSWLAGTKTGGSNPDGATWNTYDAINPWPAPGMGYAPDPVSSTRYTNAVGWVDWDLTNAVAGWMSGVYPNYGIWLVDSGARIGDTSYVSSNATVGVALRPKVTLSFLLPCNANKSQTVQLSAQADARLRADEIDKNFGGASSLVAYAGTNESRFIVRFDVSAIPPGSIVKGATLRLFAAENNSSTANPKNIDAYALVEPWVEGSRTGAGTADGVTWATRDGVVNWTIPGAAAPGPAIATGREEASGVSPLPADFERGWVTWDVTSLVQGWVDGILPNHGVLLKSGVRDRLHFDNRETGGATVPQLVVIYQ
jgi:hypothetical protein